MGIDYTFEHKDDLLIVRTTGKDVTFKEVKEYGMAILGTGLSTGSHKVLLDETDLQFSLETYDNFKSASYVSESIPHNVKIAIVCRPENYEMDIFRETVAVNRGLTVKVFTMRKNAEDWLLNP